MTSWQQATMTMSTRLSKAVGLWKKQKIHIRIGKDKIHDSQNRTCKPKGGTSILGGRGGGLGPKFCL